MLIFVCIPLCTTVVHNTAQTNFDNIPPLPPGHNHSSEADYRRTLLFNARQLILHYAKRIQEWLVHSMKSVQYSTTKISITVLQGSSNSMTAEFVNDSADAAEYFTLPKTAKFYWNFYWCYPLYFTNKSSNNTNSNAIKVKQIILYQ